MKKEDIVHLAKLARIELTDAEIERFSHDFDAILDYVGEVKGLAGAQGGEPQLPPLHNVFREDKDPHEPGIYTEDLLALAPKRHGAYVEVKKVLENNT